MNNPSIFDHNEKLALLIQKFDEGSITNIELDELADMVNLDNAESLTNFGNSDAISPIDNELNALKPELTESQLSHLDNVIVNINSKYFPEVANGIANSAAQTGTAANTVTNTLTSTLTTSSSFLGLGSLSLNAILISLSSLGILAVLMFTDVINLNFGNNKENNSNKISNNSTAITSNQQVISSEANASQTDNLTEKNDFNRSDVNLKDAISNEVNSNVVSSNDAISDEQSQSASESAAQNNKLIEEVRFVYSEELIGMIKQNNKDLNETIINLKQNLKIAGSQNNKFDYINNLYKLAVIYRIKNINIDKSREMIETAKLNVLNLEKEFANKINNNLNNNSLNANNLSADKAENEKITKQNEAIKLLKVDILGESYLIHKTIGNQDMAKIEKDNLILSINETNSKSSKRKLNYWLSK